VKVLAVNRTATMLNESYDFWHTYGSDIQNGAVVLSAIAAFAVIRSGRVSAKKRNTLDIILHQESDKELIKARVDFNELKAGAIKLATFGAADQKNSDGAQAIRKILNLHELTAVAIQEGVIDECVYRRWFNTTYKKDYAATVSYIEKARVTYENPCAFIEFERLSKKWEADKDWPKTPSFVDRKWQAIVAAIKA
jgi:hypothetical protein